MTRLPAETWSIHSSVHYSFFTVQPEISSPRHLRIKPFSRYYPNTSLWLFVSWLRTSRKKTFRGFFPHWPAITDTANRYQSFGTAIFMVQSFQTWDFRKVWNSLTFADWKCHMLLGWDNRFWKELLWVLMNDFTPEPVLVSQTKVAFRNKAWILN